MPNLIIKQIGITSPANDADRSAPLKGGVVLGMGSSAGVLTTGHYLGGAVFNRFHIGQ